MAIEAALSRADRSAPEFFVISGASSASITWEPTASRRRPDFSSPLITTVSGLSPQSHLQANAAKISNIRHAIVSPRIMPSTHAYLFFNNVVIDLRVPITSGRGIG